MTNVLFKKLLNMCVKDCLFIVDKNLYKQVDGVAMGSPLGPTLANMLLCYHEQRWLHNCPTDFKPVLYCCYVNDQFVVYREKDHATKFLHYLNMQHKNINFTLDTEEIANSPFWTY